MDFRRSYPVVGELADLFARDAPARIYLQFELSRARVQSVALVRGAAPVAATLPVYAALAEPAAAADIEERLPPNVVVLDVGEGTVPAALDWQAADGEYAIVVRSTGESIELTRMVVETANGKRYTIDIGEYCGSPQGPTYKVHDLAEFLKWWPQQYADEMHTCIEDEKNHEFYRARRYFFRLDCRTHPHLQSLNEKPLVVNQEAIRLVFENRIRNRIILVRSGAKPLAGYPSAIAPTIQMIMPLQRGLIGDCYQDNLIDHEAGIRAFANGQLRLQLDDGMWTTQPSSSAFFFFGELAIVSGRIAQLHGTKADVEFWTDIAAASVAAQRIYVAAYPPKVGEKTFGAYESCSFTKPVCEKQLEEIAPPIARDLDEIELEAAKIADEHLKDEVP